MENTNQKREQRQEVFNELFVVLKERTETNTVTSLNPILKEFNLHPGVGTVMRIDELVIDNGVIKWNPDKQPSKELAVFVEQEYFIYGRWNNDMEFLDNAIKSTELYPFDFDRLWENFGFSTRGNGKRSLLNTCDITKDFIIISNDKDERLFPDKQSNYEVIKISREGFLKWCLKAQTPVAQNRAGELLIRSAKIYSENIKLKKERYQMGYYEYLLEFLDKQSKELNKKMVNLAEYMKKMNQNGINLLMNQIEINFESSGKITDIFIQLLEETIFQLEQELFIPKKVRNDISFPKDKSGEEEHTA